MRIINPFKFSRQDKEIRQIESLLAKSLFPIEPRSDFKLRLRSQLIGGEIIIEEKQILGMDFRNFYTLLIIAGVLVGGGIVVLSGAWVILLVMYKKGWLDWAKNLLKFNKVNKSVQQSLPTG